MTKQKKVPMRICIGCMQKKPKKEMLRIVRETVGGTEEEPVYEFSLDATGRKNGRGCYVCKNAECMKSVITQKKLARQFEMNVDQTVYDRIGAEFDAYVNKN